jgi:RNA polymerase subunit RPABC4/transcription elongation factor Spt4
MQQISIRLSYSARSTCFWIEGVPFPITTIGGNMALTKCSECNKEISDEAKSCPFCGKRAPKKTSRFTWAVLALILIAVGMNVSRPDPSPEQIASAAVDAKPYKPDITIAARRVIKNSSKDADSLQFRNEFTSNYEVGGSAACGEVNGKNSFGALTGFKRFIVTGQTSMIETPDMQMFDGAWKQFCRN